MSFGEPEQPYHSFWSESPARPAATMVPVSIECFKEPVPGNYSLLFDTGEAWQAYTNGNERIVAHWPERDRAPVWIARFELNNFTKGIRITCDPDWFRTAAGWRNPLSYPLDHVLTMYALAGRGVIMHGCGVVYRESAFVFAGVSGSGKSTLARRLMNDCAGLCVLSDDRIIVEGGAGRYDAHGTPWLGEADLALNSSAPLCGILLLRKGLEFSLEQLARGAAARCLMPALAVPWYDANVMNSLLEFFDLLLTDIPVFEVIIPREGSLRSLMPGVAAEAEKIRMA